MILVDEIARIHKKLDTLDEIANFWLNAYGFE
jgi:hypothetical protein